MASDLISAQSAMVFCTKHTTEEMEMYCKNCKQATCTKCMTEDHLGHEIVTIAKFSRKLTNNRDGFVDELTAKYQGKRKRKLRKFREVKCRNDNVLSSNVKSLGERRKKLHNIIDELIDKDMNKCRTQSAKLMEDLEDVEKEQTETDNKIQEMLTTFDKTTMTGLDIIEYYDQLRSLIENMDADVDVRKYHDKLVYREGKVDSLQLQQMVGEVKDADKATASSEPVKVIATAEEATAKADPIKQTTTKRTTVKKVSKFLSKRVQEFHKLTEFEDTEVFESEEANKISELSSFRYKKSTVYNIRTVSYDEAWITYNGVDTFSLLNKSGQVVDTVPNKTANGSFLVTLDKRFISAYFNDQVVVRIDHSGNTKKVFETSPLHPLDVGPALNGNLLVTLVDELSHTRTADSQRKVQMITQEGELLHTYEFGEDGTTPVLTVPVRLAQNGNSNVCVIDEYEKRTNENRGNVRVFYEDGGQKFLYSGNGGEFYPYDVCCDSLCNIICTNVMDSSVHVIDSDGAFLEYLLTKDTCVAYPTSVALHKDMLWVGSHSGQVRVYRCKN